MLEFGAKTDVEDNFGDTPLHGAADGGHASVVNILIEHGAKLDVVDKGDVASAPKPISL